MVEDRMNWKKEFKIAAGDVISTGGLGYEVHVHSNRN